MNWLISFAAFVLMLLPVPGSAQDFNAGYAAYKSGDYATALREFTPLAVNGCSPVLDAVKPKSEKKTLEEVYGLKSPLDACARAQHYLGMMYFAGWGVPQDRVTAYVWFNISAANGVSGSEYMRGVVGHNISPAEISEAERRARVCVTSNYRDCDPARGWWFW